MVCSHVRPSLLPRSVIADPEGSWITLDVTLRAPKAGMASVPPKSTSSGFATVRLAVLCPELLLARGDESLPMQMLLFRHLPWRGTQGGGGLWQLRGSFQ